MLPHDVAKWQWENKLEPRYKGDKLSSANPFLAGFQYELEKNAISIQKTIDMTRRGVVQRGYKAPPRGMLESFREVDRPTLKAKIKDISQELYTKKIQPGGPSLASTKEAASKEWLIRRMVAGGKARAEKTSPHLLSSMPHADKYVSGFNELNKTFPEAIQRRNLRDVAGYMSAALPKS